MRFEIIGIVHYPSLPISLEVLAVIRLVHFGSNIVQRWYHTTDFKYFEEYWMLTSKVYYFMDTPVYVSNQVMFLQTLYFENEFWKCQNWIWNEIRFFIEHIRKCQSESTLILFWIGLILNKNGAYIAITHRLDDSDFVKNRSIKLAWFDWLKLCEHTTHCWLHTLLVMVCHQWLIICNMQLNKQLILKREHAVKCHSVMAADLNIWLLADHHGRLYRCWWRMLVTVSVGDILEIFLADLRCCWPIFALKSHAKNCHHHKVTKIKLSPTWLWLDGRKRQKYKSVTNISILFFFMSTK